jgi:hypothetical protein
MKASRASLVVAAISVVAGFAVFYLGVGQTVAALIELRAGNGAAGSSQDAQAAVAQLERADFWWSKPDNSFEEGALLMRLAVPATGGQYDHAALKAAEIRFARAVAGNPTDAQAWAALANARLLDQGPSAAAADALALSMELARFEPSLLAWRCQMGLAMLDVLDAGRKAALADQIRLLARRSMSELVQVAHASGKLGVVVVALGQDNDALNRFQDALHYAK